MFHFNIKIMRKIKYTVVVLSAIFTINSCDTKDLELSNPNALLPETFFKTEGQIQSSVNAAYANLQTRGLYARHIFFALDLMSGENQGNGGLEGNKKPFGNFSFDASSDIIQYYWDTCFLGISKANFVLDNEEKINALQTSIISEEKKKKFLAEAHFLRAYYYFLLLPRFGDLPIYTEQTIVGKARSPKAEVYKLIEEDFDFASKNLLSKDVEQKGRATKEAAFAYLGKVLLYQKKYDEALAAFNNVAGFTLEPKGQFYNNFMDETEHGPESIFEIEYDETLGVGDKWGSDTSGEGKAESTLRGQEYGNLDWYNVCPTDDLLDEYEAGDLRFGDTFYVPGSKYNKGANTMTAANFGNGTRRAGWKKYQNYYKRVSELQQSSINFKVMRYSDVLLMKAECENQRTGGSQTAAIAYIKEVRDRAGLITNIPATKDDVFKAIIHERKVELAGEQVRFDDLIRWGLAGTDPLLKSKGFQVGKSELWPIPNRETSSNPNIKPSDNNPGY
ncbi:RagB/SusD family nutrient uptake outer membrane protein [Flavobacterium salmonis]|uniref:RagB/SusD family nutrient uptake outer membrane protein n=2 Tax=Flavobacterium salmonis TaxID=2654844 RepID=A0A6V6YNI1_9FLAO|nr:RagB/SusD family nutrient uptake outer membrane protein [Flavobacterium salmonis]